MTTQPEMAVGSDDQHVVAAELTPEERLNAAFDDPANQKQDEEGDDPDAQAEAGDELEDDPESEAQDDDLPPIAPPVSWDDEAKEVFKALPREAQEIVQKREAEREKFVQSKSQEAAQARAAATQQAQADLAQISASYAQQLQQVAASLQAEEPDPMLQVTDPIAYAQQMRTYRQAEAQRNHAQQMATQHAQQAQALAYQAEQQHNAEQHRIIVENFPEYADPTTGPALQRSLTAVAKELGYPDELIGQARASDILAMRTAAEWKAKAEKYDALQRTKMEKVRSAKGKPPVSAKPGMAQAPGAARQQQYAADREAMRSGDTRATQRVVDSFFNNPR
jgi:hypothetical protein